MSECVQKRYRGGVCVSALPKENIKETKAKKDRQGKTQPNTASESTVSNTELNESLGAH